jgi:DNA uptake protein ComE-like DNA-binding protein
MQISRWNPRTVLALLLASVSAYSLAAGNSTPAVSASGMPAHHASTAGKSRSPAVPVAGKPVDINRASTSELMALPGISAEDASRIVAGRPYGSKAELTTRSVLPRATYEGVKGRIVAKPVKGATGRPSKP